jgi:hypothetical protein
MSGHFSTDALSRPDPVRVESLSAFCLCARYSFGTLQAFYQHRGGRHWREIESIPITLFCEDARCLRLFELNLT